LNDTARELFCYLGRLAFADKLDELVTILPRDEQQLVRDLLSEIKNISDDDLKQRIIRLRQTEIQADE
jgi:hypothetical protein